uniref:Uncharacterized protein n=1 Tax=Amphiprion percula TaxID=161767 RepID=A0A3P8TVM9_AMPPE
MVMETSASHFTLLRDPEELVERLQQSTADAAVNCPEEKDEKKTTRKSLPKQLSMDPSILACPRSMYVESAIPLTLDPILPGSVRAVQPGTFDLTALPSTSQTEQEPQPEPKTELKPEPKPVPQLEPQTDKEPEPEPQPKTEQEPEPKPESVPEPEPKQVPEPEPKQVPEQEPDLSENSL